MEGDSHEIALQILQKLYLIGPEETGSDTNGLRVAVANDNITGSHQWNEIIKAANDYGYEEVFIRLYTWSNVTDYKLYFIAFISLIIIWLLQRVRITLYFEKKNIQAQDLVYCCLPTLGFNSFSKSWLAKK